MLLDDFGGDGESEAGAALLGGEVGEEEALAHLVGESAAGVGDGELDEAGVEQGGGDAKLAQEAALHGLDGVVDQVAEGALHGFGVGEHKREVAAETAQEADLLGSAGEDGQRVFDDGVEVRRPWRGGGELGERGELVDQAAHAFDRGGDDLAAAADDGGGRGVKIGG